MPEMSSRLSSLRSILPDLETALYSFTASRAKFRIVRTVNPTSAAQVKNPKTLYILDSSFNPPSRAHAGIAVGALRRLLLLFSTSNADKGKSNTESVVQRLGLMTAFAEDVEDLLKKRSTTPSIPIDIGLTTEPYYTDKSVAIATTDPPAYPAHPAHIHLVGYDTLIRFCNPQYYPSYTPPLSALAPFFDAGHGLEVTARPFDEGDESSRAFGTVEEQSVYVEGLRRTEGALVDKGWKSEWGARVELVLDESGKGVSSTRIRESVREGRWEDVGELCTEGVAAWVKDQGLYLP
ncbi:Nucleotidylyl transferase [Massarina eburnea CBS 473.64]|uniref:Nucleotidylyl transferase n=1 Tax=Massarina eburnea CBS 473.64 TaxID=1395130 RepID=A0A6A6S7B9_9PLEO|nr:Nucleotidylyl transferase [Massarina eburnea CBS 473.64]